jgi:hypothetical protein
MLDDCAHAGCGGATGVPPERRRPAGEAARGGGEAAGRLGTDTGRDRGAAASDADAELLVVFLFYNLELLVQMRCTLFCF